MVLNIKIKLIALIPYIIVFLLFMGISYAQNIGDNLTQQQVDSINFTTVNLHESWERNNDSSVRFRVKKAGPDYRISALRGSHSLMPWWDNITNQTFYQITWELMYPSFYFRSDLLYCLSFFNLSACKQRMIGIIQDEKNDLIEYRRDKLTRYQTPDYPNQNWSQYMPE